MLTKKQLDLLDFINRRMSRDGVPPSFDEMKEALDLRSKSGIHRLITALEERQRKIHERARIAASLVTCRSYNCQLSNSTNANHCTMETMAVPTL